MWIVVRDLIVDRGGRRAVDRVSFVMEGPGWTGLVGANGSGKTSLLRALAGRIEAQGGTILVDGIDRTPDRSWRAQAIGFAPEASTMPETLSGRELFAILGGDTPGRDPEDPLAPLRRALDFDSFLDRRIGTLSAGMRQRLAIFCAFLTRPRAAILDEPFNWLDPVCAFDTREALGALVAVEGLTLITALHETTTLVRHCQSGLLLSDGQVSRSLGPADMTAGARDHAAFEAEMIAGLRGEPGRGLS